MGPTFREFNMISESYGFPIIDKLLNPSPDADTKTPITPQKENYQGGKTIKLDEFETANFIKENVTQLNKSQLKVLHKVSKMEKNEILLVQGPPGTGKTHTITAMI